MSKAPDRLDSTTVHMMLEQLRTMWLFLGQKTFENAEHAAQLREILERLQKEAVEVYNEIILDETRRFYPHLLD